MSAPTAAASDIGAATFAALCAALAAGLKVLPDKMEETAEGTLRALWHTAAGTAVSVQRATQLALPELDVAGQERLQALIAARLAGTPLAHLTGRQHFMGLEMLAGREALIPRQETELLGRGALRVLAERLATRDAARVVDVCTGSGNLALALAHHEPRARVFAADLSGEAVALARRNARHLGLDERVEFREGDLLAPFDDPAFHGNVDVLVCNPPYISSKKVDTLPQEIAGHEPRLAFDGGPLGIRILERLMREAPRFLGTGGFLVFEVGLGQGPALLKRMAGSGRYRRHEALCDEAGETRAIVAQT